MHAGAFAPGSEDVLAAGLDDAGADAQTRGAELRILHAVAAAPDVPDASAGLVVALVTAQRREERADPAVVEFGTRWSRQRLDELDGGRLDDLPAALGVQAASSEEARKCLDYVHHNHRRMRYPQFRAAGLCVSSGVLEAGCKHAIGTRLKQGGMHWTVAGGNSIIALRCCKLSNRYPDFWARRSATG